MVSCGGDAPDFEGTACANWGFPDPLRSMYHPSDACVGSSLDVPDNIPAQVKFVKIQNSFSRKETKIAISLFTKVKK